MPRDETILYVSLWAGDTRHRPTEELGSHLEIFIINFLIGTTRRKFSTGDFFPAGGDEHRARTTHRRRVNATEIAPHAQSGPTRGVPSTPNDSRGREAEMRPMSQRSLDLSH